MPLDNLILVWRIGIVALLYFFLALVFLVVWRDLRQAGRAAKSQPWGRLVVVRSEQNEPRPGHAFPLEPLTTLGRAETNLICLNDPHVSGIHASLRWQNGRWLLEDLESTNGTWVNQRPIQGITPISPGDILQVGGVQLRLEP